MTNPLTTAALDARKQRADQYVEMSQTVEGDPLRWLAWELTIKADKLEAANERITALEEALAFYASDNTYINWGATDPSYLNPSKITSDRGQIARDALKEAE